MASPGNCARATTAGEARYRIDYPNSKRRSTRIIALDDAAGATMRAMAAGPWNGARFLALVHRTKGTHGLDTIPVDLDLRETGGAVVRLSDELEDADQVVMLATAGTAGDEAGAIGRACRRRGIMTSGIIIEADGTVAVAERTMEQTLKSMRPYAAMLVVASDMDYVAELLVALRV